MTISYRDYGDTPIGVGNILQSRQQTDFLEKRSIVYHAAARGITIRSMESRLEGDIDLHGFLGMRDDVPRGYKEIRMFVTIDADAPAEQLEEIVQLGPGYSPVFDTLTRAVPVKVELDK